MKKIVLLLMLLTLPLMLLFAAALIVSNLVLLRHQRGRLQNALGLLVGSLLISALVIFPALSSMRLFNSFKGVTICSVILSVVCAFTGIIISIITGTPVGSTIVAVQVVVFGLCSLVGALKN